MDDDLRFGFRDQSSEPHFVVHVADHRHRAHLPNRGQPARVGRYDLADKARCDRVRSHEVMPVAFGRRQCLRREPAGRHQDQDVGRKSFVLGMHLFDP